MPGTVLSLSLWQPRGVETIALPFTKGEAQGPQLVTVGWGLNAWGWQCWLLSS